jgi:hypothetical protein
MRYTLLGALLLFCGLTQIAFTQSNKDPVVLPLDQVASSDIDMEQLDGQYPAASTNDPSKGVFKGREIMTYMKAYTRWNREMETFLRSNGLTWEGSLTFEQKVYCDKDGTIDYYFYRFGNDELHTPKVHSVMKDFIKTHRFRATADSKFRINGSGKATRKHG